MRSHTHNGEKTVWIDGWVQYVYMYTNMNTHLYMSVKLFDHNAQKNCVRNVHLMYDVRVVPKAFKVLQNWIKTARHHFKWIKISRDTVNALRLGKNSLQINNNFLCWNEFTIQWMKHTRRYISFQNKIEINVWKTISFSETYGRGQAVRCVE